MSIWSRQIEISPVLSRVSILTRDIDIANLSVRPSVCPSRSGIRGKRLNISSHFSPYGSPITLFYQHQTFSHNSDGVTPCEGAKYRLGIKISRFSTNKSLYLANDTEYRHSYYGSRIGTRMRSIKWCHFQWPQTNRKALVSRSHYSLTLNISQTVTDTLL